MKVYYVKLSRMKHGILQMESVDEECRVFSSMEGVEAWLLSNDFIFGQRYFFNYPDDDKEWCHKGDTHLEYVDVMISEKDMDDFSESKFKKIYF